MSEVVKLLTYFDNIEIIKICVIFIFLECPNFEGRQYF